MRDSANIETTEPEALITALGNLINAASTLQSVLVGEIGGIERERALVTFDQSLQTATDERCHHLGALEETAANPAANEPISAETQPPGAHSFNVAGQT
jgi:hypothetical protein